MLTQVSLKEKIQEPDEGKYAIGGGGLEHLQGEWKELDDGKDGDERDKNGHA